MPTDVKLLRPRVLGILQNQWFQDPPYIKRLIAASKDPERYRRRLIEFALFRGCKSGRVLRQHLGDWCDRITWENASKEIGDCASSIFPADLKHIRARIDEESPDVVVGFGNVSHEALDAVAYSRGRTPYPIYLKAPHPAARMIDIAFQFQQLRKQLESIHL